MSNTFDPDWVISPGETLREWMDENKIPSAKIVASCCRGLEERDVQGVVDGERRIDQTLATKLAVATGIPAPLWLNLERAFRQGLAEGKTWVRDGGRGDPGEGGGAVSGQDLSATPSASPVEPTRRRVQISKRILTVEVPRGQHPIFEAMLESNEQILGFAVWETIKRTRDTVEHHASVWIVAELGAEGA